MTDKIAKLEVDLAESKRLFTATIRDLVAISEELGIADDTTGGAGPIIYEIKKIREGNLTKPLNILAKNHNGMTIDYQGVLGQASQKCRRDPGLKYMLRALDKNLTELGSRYYLGDISVVDEFLQLWCIEPEAREKIVASRQGNGLTKEAAVKNAAADWCESEQKGSAVEFGFNAALQWLASRGAA